VGKGKMAKWEVMLKIQDGGLLEVCTLWVVGYYHDLHVGLSAVNEDITSGLLQREDARHRCLAYRRKVTVTNVSEVVRPRGDVGPTHDELWQKVQQFLGSNQARQYTVSTPLMHSELTSEHETYLKQLSDDFVSDMKELISQNLAKVPSGASTKQLVREVQHHTMLAKENLERVGGKWDSGRYSELLQRLQSYVKDPRQSCRPFVIYATHGGDTSMALSAVAAAVSDWLSSCRLVTVLRFIGTTTDSSDVQTCVSSVRAQIEMSCGMELSPASDSLHSELSTFRAALDHVSQTSGHTEPVFILLDGMQDLQPHSRALEALWTLCHLPINIYVIMSVTSSGHQQTGCVNVLAALLSLIGDPDLTYNISCHSDNDCMQSDGGSHLITNLVAPTLSPVDVLISTLDRMEADYGLTLVKYFASYMAVMNVGILDSEMFDLLITNDKVLAEQDCVLFTPGIVSILRQRVADFLARRLVCGRVGFSWSRPEYRQVVAERYHLIVGGAGLEAHITEASANFTVALHQDIVAIYQNSTRKSSVVEDDVDIDVDVDSYDSVRTCLQTLDARNPIKANRLLQHLCILLAVEGLDRLKSCVLFNLDWLMCRLATSPVFQIINDILSVYKLCQDMHQQAVISDSFEDVGILFEFLQLSSKALSVNHLSLPAELITRFGRSSFVRKYRSVAELVSKSRRWLDDTESSLLLPLWSVRDRLGGIRRHILDGVVHVVGSVDGADAVVGYSQRWVSVWHVQTGRMLHNFEVRPELAVSGVVVAHDGAFIITSSYSRVTQMTELTVLSTETGLSLLSVSIPHQLEVLALSKDDRLLVMSSVIRADVDSGRLIIGVHITSRDVAFQLPVVDVHSQGINNCHSFATFSLSVTVIMLLS